MSNVGNMILKTSITCKDIYLNSKLVGHVYPEIKTIVAYNVYDSNDIYEDIYNINPDNNNSNGHLLKGYKMMLIGK